MIKVINMINNSGNVVHNQFKIYTKTGCIFQSYNTIIAEYNKGQLILDNKAMDYSRTTSKYLFLFTHSNRKELMSGIKNKTIKVKDLNKE